MIFIRLQNSLYLLIIGRLQYAQTLLLTPGFWKPRTPQSCHITLVRLNCRLEVWVPMAISPQLPLATLESVVMHSVPLTLGASQIIKLKAHRIR